MAEPNRCCGPAARPARRATGLAMVELLLATALTAVLCVGLSRLVTRLAAESGPTARQALERQLQLDQALDLLARDLANARYLRVNPPGEPGGLTLLGLGALGPTPVSTPAARPVVVRYVLREVAGTVVLIRRERDAGAQDGDAAAGTLLLAGVKAFDCRAVASPRKRAPRRRGSGDGSASGGGQDGPQEQEERDGRAQPAASKRAKRAEPASLSWASATADAPREPGLAELAAGLPPCPAAVRVRLQVADAAPIQRLLVTGDRP